MGSGFSRYRSVKFPLQCTFPSFGAKSVHPSVNLPPLTICFWRGLSSTIFVNPRGMRASTLIPNQHWHKGIQSRLAEQGISIFPFSVRKGGNFSLIRSEDHTSALQSPHHLV